MRTRHAVILARGLGTRMRRTDGSDALTPEQEEAAGAGLKGMIPFARPFLDYVLSALADSGIRSATLVVGPEHDTVRDYFVRTSAGRRVTVTFADQIEARGTAHAVLSARGAVADAPFLVLNADNYYFPAEITALTMVGGNGLVAYESTELAARSGIEKTRVLRFALLDIAADDTLRAIVEKPARTDPLALQAQMWVSMNLWSFTPAIFEACERITPTERGELELASAVTYAIDEMEETFSVIRARAGVFDLSSRSDVDRVRRQLAAIDPRP
jgi:dTDP-glucose pyrophosphorylase